MLPVELEIKVANALFIEELLPLFVDYAKISNIYRTKESYRQFITQQLKNEKALILMAFIDHRPVAFLQISKAYSTLAMKQTWLLNDLFVSFEFRRKKVATQMLQHLIAIAKAEKVFSIKLTTEQSNQAAIALYQSQSFELIENHLIFSKKID